MVRQSHGKNSKKYVLSQIDNTQYQQNGVG